MAQEPPTTSLPERQGTTFSDDAVPDTDPSTTAGLLAERLQAWRYAVDHLQDYMESVEKVHKAQAKEYERVLKTISKPLKYGHHFDQSLGGIAGFFENMRTNTQSLITTNAETEKSIKGSVLPIVERLSKEIKHKAKELAHGAQKEAKEVDKARNTTQKHIELLGQHTAAFEATGGKMNALDDPYVILRGTNYRLNRQVLEENNHRNNLIAVQNNMETFEGHVIEVMQQAMETFTQFTANQAERVRALYSDMLGAVQRIPPDFEWSRFTMRSGDLLISPNEGPRAVDGIQFPNMGHPSTKPLIEGSLERKSRNKLAWGYQTGYYVVTPSKFLHEFKDSDNLRKDPTPELSIYLPDAIIGAPNGEKFNVKGKDKSKTMSSKLTGHSELAFKAHTAAEAQKWFDVIRNVAGATGPAEPASPTSPTGPERPMITTETKDHEAGITGGEMAASPTTMSAPMSATRTETRQPGSIDTTVASATGPASAAAPMSATEGTAGTAAAAPASATEAKAPMGLAT